MANLTEAEHRQLKAAHDKAIQANPALESAMKAAHEAMDKARRDLHAAMIAADPSVGPIVAKITPPKWEGNHVSQGQGGPGQPSGKPSSVIGASDKSSGKAPHEGAPLGLGLAPHGPPPGLANLTEAERQQLKAAHEKAKTDPSVTAAHAALQSAASPEARRAAGEALRRAADAAMLKADPSLAPILEKLHQDRQPQPSAQSPQGSPVPSVSPAPEASPMMMQQTPQ